MTLTPRNPMIPALMSVLIFEIVVVWLAVAGMIQVSDVPFGSALLWTAVVSVICLAACAGLRKGWGFYAGWIGQAAVILLGILTPWMFAMGIIFAVIWITTIVLGKRIEANQRESK